MADLLVYPELERCGRLGNQLWQVASTLGLARGSRMEPRFPPGWSYRPYFSLPDEWFSNEEGLHATTFAQGLDPRTRIYLQDRSFYIDVIDEVRAVFQPGAVAQDFFRRPGKPPLRIGIDRVGGSHERSPTLGLHVRRGDNLYQQDYYPVAPLDWWVTAVGEPRSSWLVDVFGDDPQWNVGYLLPRLVDEGHIALAHQLGKARCKEHEPDYWSEAVTDWKDFFLLASCDAFVLSNSSFGYWAAVLSASSDVTYQWPFYGPRLSVEGEGYCEASYMFPPNWKRLSL